MSSLPNGPLTVSKKLTKTMSLGDYPDDYYIHHVGLFTVVLISSVHSKYLEPQ